MRGQYRMKKLYKIWSDAKEKWAKRRRRRKVEKKFSHTYPSYDRKMPEAVRVLEKDLLALRNRDLQRLVRDVDADDLAVCVYGFGKKARGKVLNNLSRRFAGVIMEKVVFLPPVSEEKISEGAMKVLSVIDLLQKRGEFTNRRHAK